MSSGMEQWEEMRRRARTLEADIEQKLISFNQLSLSQVVRVRECHASCRFWFLCFAATRGMCVAFKER